MEDKRKELQEILAKKYSRINDETITEILYLFGVVVTFCRCKEKTKAYIDYSIDKKVCSKCKEVIKA